jgi:hypothetical protein
MKKNTNERHIQFLLRTISERNNEIVIFVEPNICSCMISWDSGSMKMNVPVSKFYNFSYLWSICHYWHLSVFCNTANFLIIREDIGANHVIQWYCLLGCGTMCSGRNSPFWRNLLPPFSGSKSKPSQEQEAISKHSTPHQARTIWKISHYNSIMEGSSPWDKPQPTHSPSVAPISLPKCALVHAYFSLSIPGNGLLTHSDLPVMLHIACPTAIS